MNESTQSPLSNRKKDEGEVLGQSGKGGGRIDKGRGRTKRPAGFVCWHSQL